MDLLRQWMEENAIREPVEGILSAEEFEVELRNDPIRFRDTELDFLIDDRLDENQTKEPQEPESKHEA